ncbi:NUDIX domain-containing protein [Spiractinospora alimapuensis]|uniref:NUDIX hydrolase n=1 Tax=Spiractinospora alimapuensis TaxID=2820884 RepID=UPI001F1FC03B|nr:NUDIX domain-containing protein [Spiractinospora alimapuensis]QVQ50286.1 NUDIX domain-containing protein [Spiractinospora alimapuensis]
MPSVPHAELASTLDAHTPRDGTETADLERTRALLTTPDPWDRTTPLHATASALIVHVPTRRVLMRWHPRLRAWLQVGGHADPGETDPIQVALREAREESGLDDVRPWPDQRLLHVVVVDVPANDREPAHEHADLRFALTCDSPDRARPEHSEAHLRWLTVPEAQELSGEDNVVETLDRLNQLLVTNG